MLEAVFDSSWGSFLAGLVGRNPRRAPRVVEAYASAFDQAESDGNFDDNVLSEALQAHGIPGSHTEARTGPRVGVAFAAWDRRIAPDDFYDFFLRYKG